MSNVKRNLMKTEIALLISHKGIFKTSKLPGEKRGFTLNEAVDLLKRESNPKYACAT